MSKNHKNCNLSIRLFDIFPYKIAKKVLLYVEHTDKMENVSTIITGGMKMPKIDLGTFANGSLAERFDLELQKALENIADPNTDFKTARKITMEVTLKAADDNRDVISTSVRAKIKLAPARDIETTILMDMDTKGKIVGSELKSGVKGQTFIDNEGDIANDIGDKIINLRG